MSEYNKAMLDYIIDETKEHGFGAIGVAFRADVDVLVALGKVEIDPDSDENAIRVKALPEKAQPLAVVVPPWLNKQGVELQKAIGEYTKPAPAPVPESEPVVFVQPKSVTELIREAAVELPPEPAKAVEAVPVGMESDADDDYEEEQFEIITNLTPPRRKRRSKGDAFPFDKLMVNCCFLIPPTEEIPQPHEHYKSLVRSQNTRHKMVDDKRFAIYDAAEIDATRKGAFVFRTR